MNKKAAKKSSERRQKDRMLAHPQSNVLFRNLHRPYPIVQKGKGVYLFDTNGKKYFDASGGALVTSLGHSPSRVIQAITKQMKSINYVNGMQFTSRPMLEFAAELCKIAPKGLNKVTLLGSGSEAIEAAVKFCRQLWVERGQSEKVKFIARTPGYHGNTLFALSASARPHYKKFFGELLHDVHMVPTPYEYRTRVTDYARQGGAYYAQQIEDAILKLGAANVAGVLAEPVVGSSAGASVPPPDYFKLVQAICRKHNVILIADEVMCGAGRTGKFFACEHFGLEPDILVMGKGINAGLVPMSVLLVKGEHVEEMSKGSGAFMHAQTYMQTPLMAATALAVLREMQKYKLVKNCQERGKELLKLLQKEILPLPGVGFVGGLGLMLGVELVQRKSDKSPFPRPRKVAERFVQLAFEKHGLIVWPNVGQADGSNGDLVMLGPPLNISSKEVKELVQRLKSALTEFFSEHEKAQ